MRPELEKFVLAALAVIVMSCGAGDITSGFGPKFDDFRICADLSGDYEGVATSTSGNPGGTIRMTLIQNDCRLSGAEQFAPCVPVTGIQGEAGFSPLDFDLGIVETVSTSPFLRIESVSGPDRDPDDPLPLPQQIEAYTLSTDGSNGCPTSDAGVVELTRIDAG